MSTDEPLAHYGVKGMKWGKVKSRVGKTLDAVGALGKAITDAQYDNKKATLKGEAFVADILGKPSNAKRDLRTIEALEDLAERGRAAAERMDLNKKVKKS